MELLINIIESVLTAMFLISGVGLLLLMLQNRYGRVIDRIREFNSEVVRLKNEGSKGKARYKSLKTQLCILFRRGKLLRNTMSMLYLAIFFTVCASLLTFVAFFLDDGHLGIILVLTPFSLSLLCILGGLTLAMTEIFLSYDAVQAEFAIELDKC